MSDSTLKPPTGTPLKPPAVVALAAHSSNLQLPSTAGLKPNSGSATGNPRNKCALKPGYSLMSWIKLCNSGADLSGTQGRVVPVTRNELALHNKVNDAWMAIRGKVFNVTRYIDFHPGGVDEIMRGAGRDATKLFDEVHAWVNYPQLLGKCYVGPLKENASVSAYSTPTIVDFAKPPSKPTEELVPRFDWIQQRSEITLYLYTRRNVNPGLCLRRINGQQLTASVLLGTKWHVFDFQLSASVVWPPKFAQIGSESGKIELILTKEEAAPWPNYGTHVLRQEDPPSDEFHDYDVVSCSDFNHDSFELCLKSVEQKILMQLPVGYHLDIEASVNGEDIQRSYTPISNTYLSSSSAYEFSLNFLIKRYDGGNLSSHLHKLQPGASLRLSLPRGNFQLSKLAAHRNILLLSAGSGLTPNLSLLQPLLKRNTNRIERLHLLYFNKTESDIWLKEKLADLHVKDERFSCHHILSQAVEQSQRISVELLSPFFKNEANIDKFTYMTICGPTGFNSAAIEILADIGVEANNIHVFQG
ncbi:uncharacterized protein Dwil_GK22167 [Drosophila willistoni]|uniref:Uncharacterized protein n=2 Tax=Drosophila willistoni TaxID=7260 RepID=B4MY70_DROWI|nr:uncharacterized protein Dwil_GK22167 [Drosophila willistoni]